MSPSVEDVRVVAYHEAGHAVIALHNRYSFSGISIVPSKGGKGGLGTRVPPWSATYAPSRRRAAQMRAWERGYQFLVAGREAERLHDPDRTQYGDILDQQLANHCLAGLSGLEDEQKAHAERLDAATRCLLLHYRPAIEAIVARLLRERELSSEQVRRIKRRAMRSAC